MPNINAYPFPIDIDGNELHIGDLVEYCAQPEPHVPVPRERKFKIHSLHLYKTGWWIADRRGFEVNAKDVRICYDPPTVEDILEEMLNEFVDFASKKDYSPTPAMIRIFVDRYRDKLQIKV